MRDQVETGDLHVYEFDGFVIDPSKRLLFRATGEAVQLMPKAFDILLFLVERAGNVVEKDELMTAIWPDTIVEENNLTQNISALRRTLGEKHKENRFIATVPGRGYKFVADVRRRPLEPAADVLELPGMGISVDPDKGSRAAAVRLPRKRINGVPRFWLYIFLIFAAAGAAFTAIFIWNAYGGGEKSSVNSLAVLPFKPLTPNFRDEPLEIGMADTLIMKLGGDEMVVRPLSSVLRFGSLDQDPLEAGRALKVDAVLDGSIQIAGERVRVIAKLIRVSDGRQIWANQFDERLTDIFSVQDSISERVAASLRQPGGNKEKRDTRKIEAYQLYMKGNYHIGRLITPEVEKGIGYLEQAVTLDPGYARAYVAMANAFRALTLTGDVRPAEAMLKSKEAAKRAIEIDPQLSESWSALATVNFWYDWDWQLAERNYLKAIDLDPNSSLARMSYAHLLSNLGRNDEAFAQFRTARELDPVSLTTIAAEGQALHFAGRDDESIAVLKTVIEMDSQFWLGHLFMTRPLIRKGMYTEAMASAETARKYSGGNAESLATIGYIFGVTDRREDALKIQRQLDQQAQEKYVPPYTQALVAVALGQSETALDFLERSDENRDALMMFLKVDPKWNDLRSEGRFKSLMSRLKF